MYIKLGLRPTTYLVNTKFKIEKQNEEYPSYSVCVDFSLGRCIFIKYNYIGRHSKARGCFKNSILFQAMIISFCHPIPNLCCVSHSLGA